jgi:SAM-dependent methyltransferase
VPQLTTDELHQLLMSSLTHDSFHRATFGGVLRSGVVCPWQSVVLRPVEIQNRRQIQFSYYDDRKHVAKNTEPGSPELQDALAEVLHWSFSGIHLDTAREEIDIRISKKGKALLSRRVRSTPLPAPQPQDLRHNRIKNVPFPEGTPNRVLIGLGIQNPEGQIRPKYRDKFTQINEFLLQLDQSLEALRDRLPDRPLRILDCGCGSSYLTLAAHYYLNEVRGLPAELIGVDINEEVIRKSADRAHRLDQSLNFTVGTIGRLQIVADIVIALHACDTATDDAILQAIRSRALLFLGSPCCHRHLNRQLVPSTTNVVHAPVLAQPILLQRTADILTDTFRALALKISGYEADVIEFVGTAHTPRNLMIRAIRLPKCPPGLRQSAWREYAELRDFWKVEPYLQQYLESPPAEDGPDHAFAPSADDPS